MDENASIEAHRIVIIYSFDSQGREFVEVQGDEEISSLLLLGILDTAKNRIQNPELYEDDEESDTFS